VFVIFSQDNFIICFAKNFKKPKLFAWFAFKIV